MVKKPATTVSSPPLLVSLRSSPYSMVHLSPLPMPPGAGITEVSFGFLVVVVTSNVRLLI